MPAFRFHATSAKPFHEFRRDLDTAIRDSPVADLLRHVWTRQSMNIAGPGAEGILHFHDGSVRAELRISFPATMIQERIVRDIRRLLESASGGRVTVSV